MNVGDVLDINVSRGGDSATISIPLAGATALVPQWRTRQHTTD